MFNISIYSSHTVKIMSMLLESHCDYVRSVTFDHLKIWLMTLVSWAFYNLAQIEVLNCWFILLITPPSSFCQRFNIKPGKYHRLFIVAYSFIVNVVFITKYFVIITNFSLNLTEKSNSVNLYFDTNVSGDLLKIDKIMLIFTIMLVMSNQDKQH